jgi:hypothetical protein
MRTTLSSWLPPPFSSPAHSDAPSPRRRVRRSGGSGADESGASLSQSAGREGEGTVVAVDGVRVVDSPRVGSGGGYVLDDDGEDGAIRPHGEALRCRAGTKAAGGVAGRAQHRVSARRCHRRSRWHIVGGGCREACPSGRCSLIFDNDTFFRMTR